MKSPNWLILCVLFIDVIALSACTGLSSQNQATPTPEPSPPAAYLKKNNPYSGQADAVTAGSQIFQTHCATCHGTTGQGDGPSGIVLNPKPANLTQMNPTGDTDGYIYWRISEGGGFAPFNSAMPSWKDTLSETQIWQVVTYIRTIEK